MIAVKDAPLNIFGETARDLGRKTQLEICISKYPSSRQWVNSTLVLLTRIWPEVRNRVVWEWCRFGRVTSPLGVVSSGILKYIMNMHELTPWVMNTAGVVSFVTQGWLIFKCRRLLVEVIRCFAMTYLSYRWVCARQCFHNGVMSFLH